MNLVALHVPACRHSGATFEDANLSGCKLSDYLAGLMLGQTKGITIDGIVGCDSLARLPRQDVQKAKASDEAASRCRPGSSIP